MKKISLLFITIFSALCLNAQKSKVQTAWNYYKDPFNQYDKAKESIDEAALNEQSAVMPKTWYYRGLIYQALYKHEKYGNLCDNCLITAYESFSKANQLDPKNEWADEITLMRIPGIANLIFNQGISFFNAKDYEKALLNFESVLKILPGDTAVLVNCASSSKLAGNNQKAKEYYSRLISMKYADDKIYLNIANIYKEEKDTARAMSYIKEGRAIYPDSLNLMLLEINLLLAGGHNVEATEALNAAVKKDPNNQNLYLALGSSYDNLANPKDANGKDLPKPANYNDYMTKAEDSYKKGLAINPDNYEINFNLGALYFNQAAEMANQANNLKSNDEFNKAKIKFEQKFKDAAPYLEKSLEKNPKITEDDMNIYNGTLNSLKQLYARTGETEKYNHVKELIEKK